MVKTCSVYKCTERAVKGGVSFHSFPKNEELRKKWIIALKRKNFKPNKSTRICGNHFMEPDYESHFGKQRLKPDVVPSIFDLPKRLRKPVTLRKSTKKVVFEKIKTQHVVGADAGDENITTIYHQNIEEMSIKEEPLEENSQDRELYENLMQSVKKEECISDNDEQIDKTCDNPITINNDIHKYKNTNSNGFCCIKCNKNFTWKTNLTRHMKLHKGIKKFQCATCSKSFSEKSHLIDHVKIHSGIRDYKCTICNKQFTQSSQLSRHLKNHSKTKGYKCATCKKSFRNNSNLKIHIKTIHNGIKAYKCAICNHSFTHKSSLKGHMAVHTGIKAYKCQTCQKSFTKKCNLTRHMKTHSE